MTREKLGDFYNPEDLREYEDTRPDWLKGKWGMLSDRDILRCLEEGIIQMTPLPEDLEKSINSCKINFHLGELISEFKRSQLTHVSLIEDLPPDFYEDFVMRDGKPYFLHPGTTVLAPTREILTLPNFIIARVEGKSKLARRGLGIQLAAIIDAGWTDGRPTLELQNLGNIPIKLEAGIPIGCYSFELLTSPALFPYGKQEYSRYKKQDFPRQ